MTTVRWVAGTGPWSGVQILDTSFVAQSMLSMTQDAEVAERFARSRSDNGEEHRGKRPPDSSAIDCRLQYPFAGETRDGPLFKAQEMEDKWDIYLYDDTLYFARSWTGALEYVASVRFEAARATVSSISASSALVDAEPEYCERAVDFLVRSHLLRHIVPHPLPRMYGNDTIKLALFSFSQYGRRGLFGTFEDTTELDPLPVSEA